MRPLSLVRRTVLVSTILCGMLATARAQQTVLIPKPTANFTTCAKPVWPKAALRQEQEGTVTLAFRIEPDGKVGASRIVKTSGFALLDDAARAGISLCKFKQNAPNVTAPAWMMMQYVWTLEAKPPALKAWMEGAGRGDPKDQYALAAELLKGPPSGRGAAMPLLRQSAEQNFANAQFMLANRILASKGGEGTPEEAAKWMRKAAEQGHAGAQRGLALLLLDQGDSDAALAWLRKSADQNHSAGQASLGTFLLKRAQNDEQRAEAIGLLRVAAEGDNHAAQLALARAYANGSGVPQDYAQAAPLYQRAILGGSADAMLELADLHERGLGLPVNLAEADTLRAVAQLQRRPK